MKDSAADAETLFPLRPVPGELRSEWGLRLLQLLLHPSNLLSETKEPKENTEVRDMFLLLFVVITVVLAVLMYYWKDEAIQLVRQAESVLRKLYLLVCYLPMSSFFVKNQMTIDSLGLRLSDGRGGKVLRSPSPNGNRRRRGSHSE